MEVVAIVALTVTGLIVTLSLAVMMWHSSMVILKLMIDKMESGEESH